MSTLWHKAERWLERMRDRVFGADVTVHGSIDPPASGRAPAIDVLEGDGELLVHADLPGVDARAVHVRMRGYRELLIWTESAAPFLRAISLPRAVHPDRVDASLRDGVLSVALEPLAVREIPVTTPAVA
jgi:HSP20 family molecular chaperone IbpA